MARVGIDLVCVDDVRDSLRRHPHRWLARVLSEREAGDCRVAAGVDARRVGVRLAAKEATLKVLRPARDEAIPWRAIEVRDGRLVLSGPAAARAEAAGLRRFALSAGHAAGHATAVVLAEQRPPAAAPTAVHASSWSCPEPMNTNVHDEIRRVIGDHARLAVDPAGLGDDTDLYEAGMTSHASVNLMLALEDAFDVEFPDRMLKRDVFESVGRIAAAVAELRGPS
jgi:phosphopantetheinyl transferase (holo-ACP synthase)/acyl carrier protein